MKRIISATVLSLSATTLAFAAEFADVDTNLDGLVSYEEITAAMPDLSQDLYMAADIDKDGALSAEEFEALK